MSNNRRLILRSSSQVKRACVDLEVEADRREVEEDVEVEVEEVEEVAVELRARIVELERSLAASVEQLEENYKEMGSLKESRERLTREIYCGVYMELPRESSPLPSCTRGHIFCSNCRENPEMPHTCPICRPWAME